MLDATTDVVGKPQYVAGWVICVFGKIPIKESNLLGLGLNTSVEG